MASPVGATIEPEPGALEVTAVAGEEKSGLDMPVDIAAMAIVAAIPSVLVWNRPPPLSRRSRSILGGGLRSI